MNALIPVTSAAVAAYWRLFVNRGAYTQQSFQPNPGNGRYYYFRPKTKAPGQRLRLNATTLRRHLEGAITIGLYAINPKTQRSKWVAIDADYDAAMQDLLKLQYFLREDEVDAALEMSRRGGHLWIFMQTPLLSRECRIYVHDLAQRLGIQLKGAGRADGIEIFPKHDALAAGEFGNAMRGPLGVHRATHRRYWFYGANYELDAQIAYLDRLRKLTEERLRSLIVGKALPPHFNQDSGRKHASSAFHSSRHEFHILDHVGKVRPVGRNFVTRCPACARAGRDRSGDNLSISIDDPRKYRCWAGCRKEVIRQTLGFPIPTRRSA